MQCSIKRCLLILLSFVVSITAHAGFDEATKAYLLGDFETARYEALVDAADGKPEAQMLLGQLYFNGEGVEKDLKAAMYWYEKAASQGFVDAQYRLGSLYFDGKYDIPKDYDKAYHWLQLALDNGYADAKPKLEGLFKTEAGNVVNLRESPEVLQQVADAGNKQARYLYSEKLLKGDGFPEDKAKAVAMLTEDAKQGFVKAQKRLGELYFSGDGVPQDYYEAYAWSMAYAGTKELGGLMREGKQTARSALRKLDDENHLVAYEKSREYFEQYVLPFHKNAREVGPDKYRIVVRSRKAQLEQAQQTPQTKPAVAASSDQPLATTAAKSPIDKLCDSFEDKTAERTKEDVGLIFERHKGMIYSTYNRALRKKQDIQGKVEYEIEIAPSGSVSSVTKRAESTLNEPEFEAQLVERIKQIDFCAKGSKPFMVAYPIEFIPPGAAPDKPMDPVLARTMAAVERKQEPTAGQPRVVDQLRDSVTANSTPSVPLSPVVAARTEEQSAPASNVEVTETASNKTEPEIVESDSTAIAASSVADGALKNAAPSSPSSATTETASAESTLINEADKTIASTGRETAGVVSEATVSDQRQQNEASADIVRTPLSEERSYRDVHNVFIRHKSRMNDIYLRAYEQDKNIRGRIVFELTIGADGAPGTVNLQSSELESPALEEELIDYIKTMDFGKKNAPPYEVTYPLDFLP